MFNLHFDKAIFFDKYFSYKKGTAKNDFFLSFFLE